jgi:hypothetical protein
VDVPVTESLQALGEWSITLKDTTPKAVTDAILDLGHVCVHAARQNPTISGDSLLTSARFVGVVRNRQFTDTTRLFGGPGMAFWLGDEDDKGSVIETAVQMASRTFIGGITDLLPSSGSITAGTINTVSGTPFTGSFVYQSPKKALSTFCGYWSNTFGQAEWQVTGDGKLNAGTVDQLYVTTPTAVIARKMSGQDMAVRGLLGAAEATSDLKDYSTRVVVLAQGEGEATAIGQANIAGGLNPYKDIHGNTVKLTRMVSSSDVEATNADASATLQLNRFLRAKRTLKVTTDEVDIDGVFHVGDFVWVWDPDSGMVDTNVPAGEVVFRGHRLNPLRIRVTEVTWPVSVGMGISYRDYLGNWIDLTDYLEPESGTTAITVDSDPQGLLTNLTEQVNSRPKPDASIPAAPSWVLPFAVSSYLPTSGITRAQVALQWTTPLNTDGTPIIDGAYYELQWRTTDHLINPISWATASAYTWGQLNTWDAPAPPVASGPWTSTAVGFDLNTFTIADLTPGSSVEVRIRAVDNAAAPNFGGWSSSSSITLPSDPFPPSPPAPPSIVSSLLAVQMTHTLGRASGGTFNLEADLGWLELHGDLDPLFTPTSSTLLGKVVANRGMIAAGTPIVETFKVDQVLFPTQFKVIAVDLSGNRSLPSTATSATPGLINSQYVSELTASKISAGTILVDLLIGGSLNTALAGQRTRMDISGLHTYDASNNLLVDLNSDTNVNLLTGKFQTGLSGTRVVIPTTGEINFYPSSGSNFSRINFITTTDISVRGPLDGNGRSGRMNASSTNVAMTFCDEDTLASGGLFTFLTMTQTDALLIAPTTTFAIDGMTAHPPTTARTVQFCQNDSTNANIADSFITYQRRASGGGSNMLSPSQGTGFAFFGGKMYCRNGTDTANGNFEALTLAQPSARAVKRNIRDIDWAGVKAVDLVTRVKSQQYEYLVEAAEVETPRPPFVPGLTRRVPRWQADGVTPVLDPDGAQIIDTAPAEWGYPQPTVVPKHYGPMADDIAAIAPDVVQTSPATGEMTLPLNDITGILWDAVGNVAQREVRANDVRVLSPLLSAAAPVDIPVTWPGGPLVIEPDDAMVCREGFTVAQSVRMQTTIVPLSLTRSGCTVRVTISGPDIAANAGLLHVTALSWRTTII